MVILSNSYDFVSILLLNVCDLNLEFFPLKTIAVATKEAALTLKQAPLGRFLSALTWNILLNSDELPKESKYLDWDLASTEAITWCVLTVSDDIAARTDISELLLGNSNAKSKLTMGYLQQILNFYHEEWSSSALTSRTT